jgi:diguanylate cyclase (GGDEF)-like protein
VAEELTRTFIMEAPATVDAQPAPAEREPTLVILTGARMGLVHTLQSGSAVLGRSPECEVTLEDDGVSRQHARIIVRQAGVEVEDLRSTNGTYVDGTRIAGLVRLQEGSRVRLGNVVLKFAWQDRDALRAHKHMYDMSVRDGLTGLFNRRYFDQRLESEHAFAARHRSALSVLLCDIDHFKKVNDQHGHQAGDAVLRAVAQELSDRVRTEDVVARFGGEELAIIARGIDVSGTKQFAERMRGIVEKLRIEIEGKEIGVTVSIGIAHTHAGPPVSRPEGLVLAADTALYAAKRAGRNRALLAESPGKYSVGKEDARQDSMPQQAPQEPQRRPPRERANTEPTMPATTDEVIRGISQARIRRIQ